MLSSSSQCADGDIRLVNGTNGRIGPGIIVGLVVQICYAGQWGVASIRTWTLEKPVWSADSYIMLQWP